MGLTKLCGDGKVVWFVVLSTQGDDMMDNVIEEGYAARIIVEKDIDGIKIVASEGLSAITFRSTREQAERVAQFLAESISASDPALEARFTVFSAVRYKKVVYVNA